jgi:hypothetical protein
VSTGRRRVGIGVRCQLPLAGHCQARVGVSTQWRGKPRGLAFVERTLTQDKAATLPLVLPRDVFARLRRSGRITLALRIMLVGPDGRTKTQNATLRLRYQRSRS